MMLRSAWPKLFKLMVFCVALVSMPSHAAQAQFEQFEEQLISAKFTEKSAVLSAWLAEDRDEAINLIEMMLNSQLYYEKKTKQLYRVESAKKGATAIRLWDGSKVTIEKKRAFKRVSINNKLRAEFSQLLSAAALQSPIAEERRNGALNLIGNDNDATIDQVRQLLAYEKDDSVQEAFKTVLAVHDLNAADDSVIAGAIATLGKSLEPAALVALTEFVAGHSDKGLVTKAQKAIERIGDRADWYANIETIYFGLSLGSVLVLAGIGLAITFGVMGVINMAHGELIMIGAYTTYVVQLLMPNHIEYSLFVAIPAAFVVSGLVGITIERGVIRFLYGRPLETLLATFGISLVLQQAVRSIFSPLNRSVETPSWMAGSIEINPLLSLTESRLYIIFFCLMVFFALLAVMKKTRLGLQVRAVSQNRAMAKAMGVRSEWVDAMTFGLGSGVAGVAGVALSQLTNVGPNLGQAYIIDSFMVVVFGGVGNLWGTLVAGLSLGLANKIMEPWAGAVLAKILVLIFIILFIQKRPKGLFPQRGRAAEA